MRLAQQLAKEITRAEKPHKQRVERYLRCDEIYDAVLRPTDSKWRHDLHPPFALQMIETVVSAIVEEPSEPVVKPLTPKDRDVAPKWETLLAQQRDRDHFAEKWPGFVRSGLVRGLAVAKVVWKQEWSETLHRSFNALPGNMMEEGESEYVRELVFDQPTFIPVDACDVWWNPDATCPEEIDILYFRTWETKATLLEAQKQGIYENINELQNTGQTSQPRTDDAGTGYGADTGRAGGDEVLRAGPIEIIERWTRDSLYTIADRKVPIKEDKQNRLGHGMIPFVFARPLPRNGFVVGKALPELIGDDQVALWDMLNLALDNSEVMCQSVLWMPQADDEMMQATGDRFPGQRVPIDNIALMPQWDRPNTSIIEPLLLAQDRTLQRMKDATGAVDYVSGAGEGSVDNQTATEVTLMQSGAQRRLMSFKQQFANAENRIGQQQIELNKRLMTKPELIANLSAGSYEHEAIEPYEIANSRCTYQVADVSESMNQQTRRMEATLKLQTLAGLFPLMPGEINLREAVEDFSEAYGDDREAFLNDQPPAIPGMPPGMPGMPPGGDPSMAMGGAPAPPMAMNGAPAPAPAQSSSTSPTPINFAPVINVPESHITMQPPQINVRSRPSPVPIVNVAAPNVNVAAPNVTVEAAHVETKTESSKTRKMQIQRDSKGNIISAEVVEG